MAYALGHVASPSIAALDLPRAVQACVSPVDQFAEGSGDSSRQPDLVRSHAASIGITALQVRRARNPVGGAS
jgi:hypothetical protein